MNLVLVKESVVRFIMSFMVLLCMGEEYKLVLWFYGNVYFVCVKIVNEMGRGFGDDLSLCEVCSG